MIVILNRGAGKPAANAEGSGEAIRRLFRERAQEVRVLEGRDLRALTREAASGADERIVAAGGDGTINAVASVLAGSGKILGVLPLGTLNHFAKDLGLPTDLEEAARALLSGRVARADAAEVNGRVFINNSSLGIYPHIVRDREAQQERLARGKWTAFFWATLRALRRFPFMTLTITLEGNRLVRRTAFLFVGNNEYQIAGFNLGGRKCMDAGKLGLYLTHRTGRLGLFRLAFRALLGRIEQAKDFDTYCVEEATIESRRPSLLVATDGEVSVLKTPLYYRARPRALRVIVPPRGT
ncbi:MAG TPA: diacylglycerol kinase family protein [Chthoniobacterales bacterium]|nr:diacylglycerol kinase family protein [Chthoniobacterales bacterium]